MSIPIILAVAFSVGVGRVDVTPPVGTSLGGYYRFREAEAVLDPLEATCVALSDGTDKAILVAIDHLHLEGEYSSRARKSVAKALGIRPDQVFIACSHTHTGPSSFPPKLDDPEKTKSVKRSIDGVNAMIVARITEVAEKAVRDLSPATIAIARGECRGVSFIRRYRMKDGSVKTNPGLKRGIRQPCDDYGTPLGTPDEEVQLVRFRREGKTDIALVNFQNHPDTIGGQKISADWPGHFRRTLERKLGGKAVVAFFNGAQGDLNHVPTDLKAGERAGGYGRSQAIGQKLAESVFSIWDRVAPVAAGAVAARIDAVTVPTKKFSVDQVPRFRELVRLNREGNEAELHRLCGPDEMQCVMKVAEATKCLELYESGLKSVDIEVSTVTVGRSLALCGYSGEPFTELGRQLKRESPFAMTFPCCLVNASHGYLPTASAFSEGGYEQYSSKYAAGVGEKLTETLLGNLVLPKNVLVHTDEFTDRWVDRCAELGIETISIHPCGNRWATWSLEDLLSKLKTPEYRARIDRAHALGLKVEYAFHAASWLLPRDLFSEHPEWFRMGTNGVRTADLNFCASNTEALDYAAERARKLVKSLYGSSAHYSFWLDDAPDSGCHCPKCAGYSDSDQQLIMLNRFIGRMREERPDAELAYLAYYSALPPPTKVKPSPGIVLEFAPINRRHDLPLCDQKAPGMEYVDSLMKCFGSRHARVVEYWLDNSYFSRQRKPERRFLPRPEVERLDFRFYERLGFEELATFACYLGPKYEEMWGEPDVGGFSKRKYLQRADGSVRFRGLYDTKGRRDDTVFGCWCEGGRLFFRFDVVDRTVCAAGVVTAKRDLENFDRVEVYFAPTADLKKPYCVLEIDPYGRVLDYRATYYRQMDYAWHAKTLRTKARVVADGYIVEGSIALDELAENGIDASAFHLGAFRADFSSPGTIADWYAAVPQGEGEPDFHRQTMFFPVRGLPRNCAHTCEQPANL